MGREGTRAMDGGEQWAAAPAWRERHRVCCALCRGLCGARHMQPHTRTRLFDRVQSCRLVAERQEGGARVKVHHNDAIHFFLPIPAMRSNEQHFNIALHECFIALSSYKIYTQDDGDADPNQALSSPQTVAHYTHIPRRSRSISLL